MDILQQAMRSRGVEPAQVAVGVGLGAVVLAAMMLLFGKKRAGKGPIALDGNKKISLALVEKEELSHDTRRFRFALQSPKHVLGLPVGKHIYLSTTINDKLVSRPYTPTTSDDEVGYFDLVVKVYFANVHPKFPDGGKLTQHLERMAIGEHIDVRGPNGKLTYQGRGTFNIKQLHGETTKRAKRVGMIAGGSGVTPMAQIIRAVLKDPKDATELYLLFANQTEDDILLRKELEAIAEEHANFHLWYTLDRPPAKWTYSSGFVNDLMVKEHLPPAAPDTLVLMCGPPPMLKFACIPALEKLGHDAENYFCF